MARHEKFVALRKLLELKATVLKRDGETSFRMKFVEVEMCLGFALPRSAYEHREWWANNNDRYRPNSLTDRPSKVWERAGFRTRNVDMTEKEVTFEYKGPLSPQDKARRDAKAAENAAKTRQVLSQLRQQRVASASGMSEATRAYSEHKPHPAFGSMKGLIRIVAGTDLTKPADPDWGKRDR